MKTDNLKHNHFTLFDCYISPYCFKILISIPDICFPLVSRQSFKHSHTVTKIHSSHRFRPFNVAMYGCQSIQSPMLIAFDHVKSNTIIIGLHFICDIHLHNWLYIESNQFITSSRRKTFLSVCNIRFDLLWRLPMEYTATEDKFRNFQMNPIDLVPTEISNSDEELVNSFDPNAPKLKKWKKK